MAQFVAEFSQVETFKTVMSLMEKLVDVVTLELEQTSQKMKIQTMDSSNVVFLVLVFRPLAFKTFHL